MVVTAVNPDGTAQVQGSRTVTVQGKNESITVGGVVSPSLLDQKGSISFSRLANARLTYTTFLASAKDVLTQADLQRLLPPSPPAAAAAAPAGTAAPSPGAQPAAPLRLPQQGTPAAAGTRPLRPPGPGVPGTDHLRRPQEAAPPPVSQSAHRHRIPTVTMRPSVLSRYNSPDDLRGMTEQGLRQLAGEIRQLIMEVVSRNGGHLASNLGVVELAIALHRVFRSPRDAIIWDVGHQCYAHKILTGRRDLFPTLRERGGISGFPRSGESPHDVVQTGHASTAISYGLGLLTGRQMRGEPGRVIAVVGDGALTGGLALEGLNSAGHARRGLIIILNDNAMSIGHNVGAMSAYLGRLTTTRLYQLFRRRFDDTVRRVPVHRKRADGVGGRG